MPAFLGPRHVSDRRFFSSPVGRSPSEPRTASRPAASRATDGDGELATDGDGGREPRDRPTLGDEGLGDLGKLRHYQERPEFLRDKRSTEG